MPPTVASIVNLHLRISIFNVIGTVHLLMIRFISDKGAGDIFIDLYVG